MIKLVVATLLLLTSGAVGCTDACQTLADKACARHGETSLICVSRSRELEQRSAGQTRICERALMLMRSLPESELE